jgi:tetratricopeptide (TPR) repeat protein
MRGLFLIVGILGFSAGVWAQPEPQDAAHKPDPFEEHLFDSFKEKAMENYDKAIEQLEQCKDLKPDSAIVYFELGKNYYFQRNYVKAYAAFEKATQLAPDNRWAWVGLYDICYDTKDYDRAIPIVEKLIQIKDEYKEDLVSLYMMTLQHEKALTLIHELEERYGRTEKRDLYKADILKDAKFQGPERSTLLQRIEKFPQEEANYLELISLYNQSGQEDKAMDIARKLEKAIPSSDWAQVGLYKTFLVQQQTAQAVQALKKIVLSTKIDWKIKQRSFNEMLIYVQTHPEAEADFNALIPNMSNDRSVQVQKELGKFYYNKSNWSKAIFYLSSHCKSDATDREALLLLLQAQTEAGRFPELEKQADEALSWFPAQAELYYYKGLALNQMGQFKAAKEALESGLDYLIDNKPLEINWNIQLGQTYLGLGDVSKKEQYYKRANDLIEKSKKAKP